MKKIPLLIIGFISLSVQAQTPPNESCAISLQIGPAHYHYCDDGLYEGKDKKIDAGKWNSLRAQLQVEDEGQPAPDSTNVRIPNDSCALGFRYGGKFLYRCEQGLFSLERGKVVGLKASDWNKQLEFVPSPTVENVNEDEEIATGLEGCIKLGAVIECPDGKYIKSGAVVDTTQKKVFDSVRPDPKQRRKGKNSPQVKSH